MNKQALVTQRTDPATTESRGTLPATFTKLVIFPMSRIRSLVNGFIS
jgi:hypothetical protein